MLRLRVQICNSGQQQISFDQLDMERETNMKISIGPIAALIAGILILFMPKLLNFIVAIYLIIIGLAGLISANSIRLP